jgi:glycosyltransferase involved in cell wall biosynthesis
MRRADADVYVYRGAPRKAAVVNVLARVLGGRFVYHLANDEDLRSHREALSTPFRRAFDYAVSSAEAVVAQTERQATMVEQRYDRTPRIVPNGYPPLENPTPDGHDGFVLWVGRLDPEQKRPELVLDIADRCPDVEFLVVGPSGTDEESSTAIIEQLEDAHNVTYEGVIDPDTIHSYYARAACLLNTAAYEGFPNTFLESWRTGTPVLSLDVDPNRFVSTSDTLPFADGDLDRLANHVRRCVTDEAARSTWGDAARTAFEREYTIDTVADEYTEVLRDACR